MSLHQYWFNQTDLYWKTKTINGDGDIFQHFTPLATLTEAGKNAGLALLIGPMFLESPWKKGLKQEQNIIFVLSKFENNLLLVDFPAAITPHFDKESSLGQLVQWRYHDHSVFGASEILRDIVTYVGNFLIKSAVVLLIHFETSTAFTRLAKGVWST